MRATNSHRACFEAVTYQLPVSNIASTPQNGGAGRYQRAAPSDYGVRHQHLQPLGNFIRSLFVAGGATIIGPGRGAGALPKRKCHGLKSHHPRRARKLRRIPRRRVRQAACHPGALHLLLRDGLAARQGRSDPGSSKAVRTIDCLARGRPARTPRQPVAVRCSYVQHRTSPERRGRCTT